MLWPIRIEKLFLYRTKSVAQGSVLSPVIIYVISSRQRLYYLMCVPVLRKRGGVYIARIHMLG